MEQARQAMVISYKDMVKVMVAALGRKMDEFTQQTAQKSEPASYQQGAKKPQVTRRAQIAKVLVKLGSKQADFAPGGSYAHTSDNELYNIAKTQLAAYRRRQAAQP